MDLREELPGDAESVRDVHLRAFGGHGRAVADLVDTLRASVTPADGLSLVAEHDDRVVGHVMFTRGLLDAPRRLVDVQVLSPPAVLPEHQRTGIGAALVRHGLRTLAGRAVPVVFVEGDPAYYARLGFLPGGDHGFRKPSLRIPDAAFRAMALPAYEPWMTGTLVYAEPFWRHDAVGLRDPAAPENHVPRGAPQPTIHAWPP
ncbi:N-acetyltransferase [Actinacidiphila glaucinigra]|uniref:GNAT family N-acetyltransferase n=1 Tax=Actinacidiphila glaucinigra TaxID=235986 RepID=UPI002DD8D84F|nr:N-acetyltransferase [Actinacidiphila glaucinigra]WSD64551.1 N-acetyltransferase [Actinacidiphila glaucinigra]